ncbi:MAG: HD domain-containing protein [Bacteroidota bacterium]|nr:HD domain-containing protein [Bacteroidota bacterium]
MACDAYVVGGYVRDIFMGRTSKDIDIVVVGSGIDLAVKLSHSLGKKGKINIFKNFGTAMIKIEDTEIEFVGARKESYRSHSRKPIVENGTLEDDSKRRDFTINAMAISLNKNNYGQLIDPFNGINDIKLKIIRTPLNANITYSDDPLRMMRAIRFASQLDFNIHPDSFRAIRKNKERIRIVSFERIIDEVNKIIMSSVPSKGFNLLFESELLDIIFPQMVALKSNDMQETKGHKDNFNHTLEVLDNVSRVSDNLWLRWAAILHDIAKPLTKKYDAVNGWSFHNHEFIGAKMVSKIFRHLKLPMNEKMKYVEKLVLLHLRPIALVEEDVTDSAIRRLLFEAGEDIDDLMILCSADITSKNPDKVRRYKHNFEIVREKMRIIEEKDQLRNWQPPITGDEIMKTFGINPSKPVGVIKTAIREAILEGIIPNDYDKAYNLMLEEGRKLGLNVVESKKLKVKS